MVAKLIDEAPDVAGEIWLEEVDVTERPEVALGYRVLSTPAIAINGRLEFLAIPGEEALLARLRAARDEKRP